MVRVLLTKLLFMAGLLALVGVATSLGATIIAVTIESGWIVPVIAFVAGIMLVLYVGALWLLYLALLEVLEYKR
jgi:hypothetical protein